jgi:hypothetical protein
VKAAEARAAVVAAQNQLTIAAALKMKPTVAQALALTSAVTGLTPVLAWIDAQKKCPEQ